MRTIGDYLGRRLAGPGALLWPVAWLALARLLLVERFDDCLPGGRHLIGLFEPIMLKLHDGERRAGLIKRRSSDCVTGIGMRGQFTYGCSVCRGAQTGRVM